MNRKSTENLRLDRRLIGRRGGPSRDELARELDSLPDVSDKAVPIESGGEEGAPSAPEDAQVN